VARALDDKQAAKFRVGAAVSLVSIPPFSPTHLSRSLIGKKATVERVGRGGGKKNRYYIRFGAGPYDCSWISEQYLRAYTEVEE